MLLLFLGKPRIEEAVVNLSEDSCDENEPGGTRETRVNAKNADAGQISRSATALPTLTPWKYPL